MKLVAASALLLSLAGWALLILTFVNLLSGSLETRACGSECVRGYYFGASGLGVLGVLLGFTAALSDRGRQLGLFSLLLALPLLGVTVALFLIGNFGHLVH